MKLIIYGEALLGAEGGWRKVRWRMNGHRCVPELLYVVPLWKDKCICLMLGKSLCGVDNNSWHLFKKSFLYYSIHSRGQSKASSDIKLGRRHLQKKRFVKFSSASLFLKTSLPHSTSFLGATVAAWAGSCWSQGPCPGDHSLGWLKLRLRPG